MAGVVSVTDNNTIFVQVIRDTGNMDEVIIKLLDSNGFQVDNASIPLPNEDLTVSYCVP